MPKFTLPDRLKTDTKKEEKVQHIGIIADIPNPRELVMELHSRYNLGLPACGINPRKPETLKLENVKKSKNVPIEELLNPIKKQKKNKKSGPRS